MKAVSKKLFSLMLVAILLVSAVPFQASASEVETAAPAAETQAPVVETQAPVVETQAPVVETGAVQVEVTVPAAQAAETLSKDRVKVHFQLGDEYGNIQVGKIASSKLGSKVSSSSIPSASSAEKVLGQVIGNATGYEFVRWVYETPDGEMKKFSSSVYLNINNMVLDETGEDKDGEYFILNVFAEFHKAAETITLKPNKGTLKSTSYSVVVGEPYGELPTPTRANATFLGWYKTDDVTKTIIDAETIVEDLTSLTALWATANYNVVFEAYLNTEGDGAGDWDAVELFTFTGDYAVEAKSTLKAADGYFPTASQIKELFLGEMDDDGWYVDGWEIVETGKEFVAGKTTITDDVTIRPVYKKSITLRADDQGSTTRKFTVTLGKRVGILPNPGTREGLTFMAWVADNDVEVANRHNLSDASAHEVYYPAMGNFTGTWEASKTIYLYIHTDGDTDDHTKLVRYYDAPASGFYLTDIDLGDIFASYGKYDDDGDEQWGWYNPAQWENYCRGRHKNDTTEYVGENEDDILEFYIMLIDKGNNSANSGASGSGSGYNDNNKTVDPSNPSTGDEIFMAATIMAASATALALVFFLNKKRIAK